MIIFVLSIEENKTEDVQFCNHYTNLQPLLSQDNGSKANKWGVEDEKKYRTTIKCNRKWSTIYYPP